jgi:nucleoside-diphosphate-sugar epimerase
MRFLVTGGTGFIGSNMVELLLSCGWEVVCPVRDISSLKYLDGLPATVVSVDDLEKEIAANPGFDYVIHLAGATRALDYEAYYRANVQLTRNLLETLLRHNGKDSLRRFVLVSSQAVAGPTPEQMTFLEESDPPYPISLYGRTKLEAEQMAMSFLDRVPITIVRPPRYSDPETGMFSMFSNVPDSDWLLT